jgi:hypothetical protein
MGKFLEMIARALILCLVSSLALQGCGSPIVKGAIGKMAGAVPSAGTVAPAIDGRKRFLVYTNKNIKFPIFPVQSDNGLEIWATQDGSQLALRHGVLVWTRGFGMDMMSSDAPSAATILRQGASHQRQFQWLNGTGVPAFATYNCQTEQVSYDGDAAGDARFSETCGGPYGAFKNEYITDSSGAVLEAKQWVSPQVGTLYFEPVE